MQNTRKYYEQLVSSSRDYKQMLIHFLQAFFCGGGICLLGQGLLEILRNYFVSEMANLYLSIIMISFAAILTAIGVYDEIGEYAKCGLAIPITGFANACVSAALEYKREGLVLGIGSNALKVAGSVIVLGTASAFCVNVLRYIFEALS